MRQKRWWILVLLVCATLAGCSDDQDGDGCTVDTDCKLDRVCVSGTCTTASTNNSLGPDAGQPDAEQPDAQSCAPGADTDGDRINDCDELARGTDPESADTDNDGIDDHREVFRTGTDPTNADTDGDGLSDGDELDTHETDPFEADSDSDGLSDGDEVNQHNSDPLEADTDGDGLKDGAEVDEYGSDPTATDTDSDGLTDREEVREHGSDPSETDTDGDGIDDFTEVDEHGTDPTMADTDSDGIDDQSEIDAGTNPTLADTDRDGLNDDAEAANNTDPLEPDTDGDGLYDGEEIELGTDPLQADSDGDGLSDSDEVLTHGSDPLGADTDGDGLTDGEEVAWGLDPTKTSSFDDGVEDADRWFIDACSGQTGTSGQGYQTHTSSAGGWMLALDAEFTQFTELQDAQGSSLDAAVFRNADDSVHGLIASEPAIAGATANELLRDKLASLSSLGTVAHEWSFGAFTTHDGYSAARGHYMVQTASQASSTVRDRLVESLAPFAQTDVANFPAENGVSATSFRVDLTVVKHAQNHVILATVIEEQTLANAPARQLLAKSAVDTTGLTAPGGAAVGVCELFAPFAAHAPVEFYWVLDQSGSMSDDYGRLTSAYAGFFTQLATAGFDWRLGVTSMDEAEQGFLSVPPGWHSDVNTFNAEINRITNWNGNLYEEYGLKVAQDGLTDMLVGASSHAPIRSNASVITVFLSDEEAQTFQNIWPTPPIGQQALTDFINFFSGKTAPITLGGDGDQCGTHEAVAYREVSVQAGGAHGILCDDFATNLDNIFHLAAGRATNYTLPTVPVSSSITVFVGGQEVAQSRTDGWEYYPESNSIAFFGSARPALQGSQAVPNGERVAVVYETLSP